MRLFKVGALQWAVGAFCAVTGALMLLVPHQFGGPSYAALAGVLPGWGAAFLLAGVGLIGVAALTPRRVIAIPVHLLAGVLLLALAASFGAARSWTGIAVYLPLGIGVLLAPWLPALRSRVGDGRDTERTSPEVLSIAIGVGAMLNGLPFLIFPGHFDAPTYDAIRPRLTWYGHAFLWLGYWVVACSLVERAPTWMWRSAHLALAGLLLLFCGEHPLRGGILTDVAYYGGLGLALAAVPWVARPLEHIDASSLRTRLAFVLAVVAAAPLLLVSALDAGRSERLLVAESLNVQRTLAAVLAQEVSSYVGLHRSATLALAAQPGILDRTSAEQVGLLRAVRWSYPDLIALVIVDLDGRVRVRSSEDVPARIEDATLLSAIGQPGPPTFRALTSSMTGRPAVAVGGPIVGRDGRPEAALVGGIATNRLAASLADRVRGLDGRSYLVDSDGHLIAHSQPADAEPFADLSAEPPVAALLAASASGTLRHGGPNGDTLTGYARVPGLGWGLVVDRPVGAVLAGERARNVLTFGVIVLVIVAAAIAGTLVAQWLTSPLRVLGRALADVGEGERALALPRSRVTEVAGLTASFAMLHERLTARTAERNRREQELRDRTRQQRVVVELGQVALQDGGLRALLDTVPARVAETLDVRCVAVWETLDAGRCRLVAGSGWPDDLVGRDDALPCSPLADGRGMTRVPEALIELPVLRSLGMVEVAGVPISLDRGTYGVLAVYAAGPRDQATGDEQFLRSVANVLAGAIERDRTERTRAELAALVESSDDAIVGVALDGTITAWNRGSVRLYGYTVDEAIGRPEAIIVPEDRADEHRDVLEALRRGDHVEHVETVRLHKDGRAVEVSSSASPIRDAAGRVTGGAVVAHDVTAEREQQRRNVQGEKLRALGQMAGGVAHDLNQSLALVAGYADLARQALAQQAPDLAAIQEMLGITRQAAHSGGETVKRLLTFARGRPTDQLEPLELGVLLREVAQLTAPRWGGAAQAEGRPIHLEIQVDGDTTVEASRSGLRDALTNLVMNAIDAMPSGGDVKLTARRVGERVLVTVADTGTGMTSEVREKIFEPFFSTKGERGTGLGLAMVFGLIRRHGGQISVESQPGAGTTFLLNFPAATPARDGAVEGMAPTTDLETGARIGGNGRAHAGVGPDGGADNGVVHAQGNGVSKQQSDALDASGGSRRLRVLAVDDEPALASMAAMMVRRLGDEAETSTSAEDALDRLEAARFDVLLSDIGMGTGMNGWELAAEARRRWPSMRIIVATGWGAIIDDAEARSRGVDAVLAKPYRSADVRRVLRAPDVAAEA